MDAFIGEIRAFGFNYAPEGWLFCNGQTYPIQQYQALSSVVSFLYGGDGRDTFGVPNIQSLVLMGSGQLAGGGNFTCAQKGGANTVTLSPSDMPPHNHTIYGYAGGTQSGWTSNPSPTSRLTNMVEVTTITPSPNKAGSLYAPSTDNELVTLDDNTLPAYPGLGGAHDNLQPYMVFNYCICWDGVYPVRN
jgi:microcystin-dependent protein